MKILYVIDSLCGGGAEKLVNDLLPLIKKNHLCELIILSAKDDKYSATLKQKGIAVHLASGKIAISQIRYIKNYIVKNNFDIVHVHLFPANYYCALAKMITGKKFPILIATEHNTDNRRRHIALLKPIEKLVYSCFDHVISISEETQKALLKWLHTDHKNKYTVIENGIDLKAFYNAQSYDRLKLSDYIRQDDILLCMIGSFTEQKNHRFMLEVMKKLPDKYKILFLGEGILLGDIKKIVSNSDLTKRVFFLGFRKDVPNLLKTSDIVVIPSKWEGFGLVAAEALACGKPIVASDVPGLAQVVGECGKKVKINNVMGFVEQIEAACSLINDHNYVKKCILRAQKFDIYNMQIRYENLYKNLLRNY